MASGTGGFDAKPVAGWAEEHADGHFAHHARVTRMRTRRVPKTKSSLSEAVINKLIRSNCGGLSWPEAALRRLMSSSKEKTLRHCAVDKRRPQHQGREKNYFSWGKCFFDHWQVISLFHYSVWGVTNSLSNPASTPGCAGRRAQKPSPSDAP